MFLSTRNQTIIHHVFLELVKIGIENFQFFCSVSVQHLRRRRRMAAAGRGRRSRLAAAGRGGWAVGGRSRWLAAAAVGDGCSIGGPAAEGRSLRPAAAAVGGGRRWLPIVATVATAAGSPPPPQQQQQARRKSGR